MSSPVSKKKGDGFFTANLNIFSDDSDDSDDIFNDPRNSTLSRIALDKINKINGVNLEGSEILGRDLEIVEIEGEITEGDKLLRQEEEESEVEEEEGNLFRENEVKDSSEVEASDLRTEKWKKETWEEIERNIEEWKKEWETKKGKEKKAHRNREAKNYSTSEKRENKLLSDEELRSFCERVLDELSTIKTIKKRKELIQSTNVRITKIVEKAYRSLLLSPSKERRKMLNFYFNKIKDIVFPHLKIENKGKTCRKDQKKITEIVANGIRGQAANGIRGQAANGIQDKEKDELLIGEIMVKIKEVKDFRVMPEKKRIMQTLKLMRPIVELCSDNESLISEEQLLCEKNKLKENYTTMLREKPNKFSTLKILSLLTKELKNDVNFKWNLSFSSLMKICEEARKDYVREKQKSKQKKANSSTPRAETGGSSQKKKKLKLNETST